MPSNQALQDAIDASHKAADRAESIDAPPTPEAPGIGDALGALLGVGARLVAVAADQVTEDQIKALAAAVIKAAVGAAERYSGGTK